MRAHPAAIWFYSARWLNNCFINDFPHAERASECRKKKQTNSRTKRERQKCSSCVKALSCFFNRSSLSITDCQLPARFDDQGEFRDAPSSKAWQRGLMGPPRTRARVCAYVAVRACVRMAPLGSLPLTTLRRIYIYISKDFSAKVEIYM